MSGQRVGLDTVGDRQHHAGSVEQHNGDSDELQDWEEQSWSEEEIQYEMEQEEEIRQGHEIERGTVGARPNGPNAISTRGRGAPLALGAHIEMQARTRYVGRHLRKGRISVMPVVHTAGASEQEEATTIGRTGLEQASVLEARSRGVNAAAAKHGSHTTATTNTVGRSSAAYLMGPGSSQRH